MIRINITLRQSQIIQFLSSVSSASAQEILDYLTQTNITEVSRPTINRDIEELVEIELLAKEGSGPSTKYLLTPKARLNTYFDSVTYFNLSAENRNSYPSFNWQIFDLLNDATIFSDSEANRLAALNNEYQSQRSLLSDTIIRKENERVTIELSWKSSKIEGNTYSLLETEDLLKNGKESIGKTEEETQMILNHKVAIDYIFNNPEEFLNINIPQIEQLHSMLVDKLNIQKGIRKTLVGITGTVYKPLDNEHQIREALTKTTDLINSIEDVFTKSMLAILMISYIQPFEDGNKRTSRILGNALLLSNKIFPLSFRSVDEVKYKEGTLLFYEQNNISLFKQIYLEQCEFAVKNYFRSSI